MRLRAEWVVLIMTLVVLTMLSGAILITAYAHSFEALEAKGWCYGEFGHPRPMRFCNE